MARHKTIETLILAGLARYAGRPSEKPHKSMARNLVRHLGPIRAARLVSAHIRAYRTARENEGARASYVNREIRLLRAILREAVDRGEIRGLRVIRWHEAAEPQQTRVLGVEEFRQITSWLAQRDAWAADIVRVLVGCGARSGELLGAPAGSWEDLGETGRIVIEDTKEDDGKVLVVVNGALDAARRLAGRKLARPFASAAGRTPAQDHELLAARLRAAAKACGTEHVWPHALRHTFASWALRGGVTLEAVGQTLGHKSLETTRRYARIDEAVRTAAAAVVTRAFE